MKWYKVGGGKEIMRLLVFCTTQAHSLRFLYNNGLTMLPATVFSGLTALQELCVNA